MKTLALVFACFLAITARAETISFSDQDPNEDRASIAVELISALRDGGLKFKAGENGTFTISAKNIRCDSRHNGALDSADPQAGVPTTKCRINTRNVRDSRKGSSLREASDLNNLLAVRLELGDCAMGYCGVWAQSIQCTVDTKVEQFIGGGRFRCTVNTGDSAN
jgi:hypothetical protein